MLFAIRHLVPAAFRAIFRMLFLGILFAIIAGGITLIVAYANRPHWPPNALTIAVAVVIALLAGYAVGLTTLVSEVVRGVKDAERDIVRGVESEVADHEHSHV